jgi:hypothetical protein
MKTTIVTVLCLIGVGVILLVIVTKSDFIGANHPSSVPVNHVELAPVAPGSVKTVFPVEPNWKERKAYWSDQFTRQNKQTELVRFVEDGLQGDQEEYAKSLDIAYADLIADVTSKLDSVLKEKGLDVKGHVFQVVKSGILLNVLSGIPIMSEDYYGYSGGIVLVKGSGSEVVDGAYWSGYVNLVGTGTYETILGSSNKILVFSPVPAAKLKQCDREMRFLSDRLNALCVERKKVVFRAWKIGETIGEMVKAEKVMAEAKAKELARLVKEAKDKADALAEFQAKERADERAAIKAKADAEIAAQIAAKAKEAADRAKEEAEAAMLIDDLKDKALPPDPIQNAPKTKPVKVVFAPKDWLTGTWQYKDGSRIWYRDYANGKFRVRVGRRVEWVGVYSILSPTEAISEGAGSKQGITLRQDGTLNIAGKYRASRVADHLTGR